MIVIVGADGNMGKRYQAILTYLGKPWVGVDKYWAKANKNDKLFFEPDKVEGVIVASPTDNHVEHIYHFIQYQVPILCEKPISKDMLELTSLIKVVWREQVKLDMVHQYSLLATSQKNAPTKYDYFKHGNDGLHWDCIQPISLARGEIILEEKSPIWTCEINGQALDLAKMDLAYVEMIREWLKRPQSKALDILDVHFKVKDLIDASTNSSHWNPSA